MRLQVGPPDDGGGTERDDAPYVWAVVSADGDELAAIVAKLIFERDDAAGCRDDFYTAVQDWVCFSAFGWGQLRVGDVSEPPSTTLAGTAPLHLEFYPDQDARSPLWEGGTNVALEGLHLSRALSLALVQWLQRWAQLTDEDEPYVGWTAMVEELEPERRRLVAALRRELPGDIDVAEPIPLDEMTRRWRAGDAPSLPAKESPGR